MLIFFQSIMNGTLTHEPVGLLELLDCKGQGREVSERTTISSFHLRKGRMSIWRIEIIGQFGDGTPSQFGEFIRWDSQCGESIRVLN